MSSYGKQFCTSALRRQVKSPTRVKPTCVRFSSQPEGRLGQAREQLAPLMDEGHHIGGHALVGGELLVVGCVRRKLGV